jgi:transposase
MERVAFWGVSLRAPKWALGELVMAKDYRSADRDQPFLVPPDMRDWLPSDHLAWFILEVVQQLDTGALHERSKRGGTGREGFNPELLLAVWVYASARGISSSRQIERACSEDVAFRVLCAQDVPDHTVLARFRQRHQDAMAGLFAQVLALCVREGLGRFGVIAIDGTKIKANASKDKTRTLKRLRQIAETEFDKAAATDAAEDAAHAPTAHDDLPPGFAPGSDRASRIRAAIKDLEDVVEADNKPDIDKFQARLVKAEAKLARLLQKAPGTETTRVVDARRGVEHNKALIARAERASAEQAAGEVDRTRRTRKLLQRNTTDPQARIMHTRSGFIVGYNAQTVVLDGQLILAVKATAEPNDLQQLIPMMDKSVAAIEYCQNTTDRTDLNVGTVVADNGYLSDENVRAPGYDRLIAPGRGTMKGGEWVGKIKGREGAKITAAAGAMVEKLALPGNQAIYNQRSPIVEPVNGHLKDRRGLRQFSRRGLAAVDAELNMAAMTTNLMKLFTTIWQPARTAT